MFDDRVKIFIKSGNGGNGKTSFRTEKYVRKGGPDGGDGGKGGDIIFVATSHLNDLVEFRFTKHFLAKDGENGGARNCTGKSGENLIISVPCGTVIRDGESSEIMADMFYDGQSFTILRGGLGGKGNAHFKSSKRQTPTFSQTGEITKERTVWLELKMIADVGLVGFPNVGKSTLLSVLTEAKPKIANYHFTTLSPNLGALKVNGRSFVIADIPGLIENASEGAGLGHYFLRHVERTRLLLHIIDISGSEDRDPYVDFRTINTELKKYDKKLALLPQIVVLNKCDMATEKQIKSFCLKVSKLKTQYTICKISALTHSGVDDLISVIAGAVEKLPEVKPLEFKPFVFEEENKNHYDITRSDDGAFVLSGGFIDELIRAVNLDSYESFSYFQKVLKEKGIIKELKKRGMTETSTVRIYDMDFEFVE